eukprot:TRINITY_DN537_c0_g1_i3.p1 TRINITY_DN537_c0_g1~~TRINITY_DN537_c0_g1_i3.p1  ORF type:complete len:147 (-),score=18.67 TRINITY_DN537_c0_g1_i3:109-549(-)
MGYRTMLAGIAGALYGLGWVVWVDAIVYESVKDLKPEIDWLFYMPGFIATFGLIMQNIVNYEGLRGDSFLSGNYSAQIRAWLLVSFLVSFGSIAAAIWIMIAKWLPPHNSETQWPGVAMVVQAVVIFISSLLLVWGKNLNPGYSAI